MVRASCFAILGMLASAFSPLGLAQAEDAKDEHPKAASCLECIRIRVGLPRIVRAPPDSPVDNPFSLIKLPNGRFRGFIAVGTSYAVDGASPWDMGGPAIPVLKAGGPGSMARCGQWLQHVERAGDRLVGFVHVETACDYAHGQTHKSTGFATSADEGLSWRVEGLILTGKDEPTTGRNTGEGDCSVINGGDGFYYAYCGRARDGLPYVARAPVTNPHPGNWKKYFNGAWSEPGLGGEVSGVGAVGVASFWTTAGETVKATFVPGGMGLAFSPDRVHFTNFPQPLLKLDKGPWDRRGHPAELVAYMSLIDAATGQNYLGDRWLLAYMYLQPDEGFDKRYLVFRPIEVSRSRQADEPPVAVALGRWRNAALHDRWSTTAPVPGNYGAYALEREIGYLLTAAEASEPSVELQDCVSEWPGHPDHLLEEQGACDSGHYRRLRTAGWVYAKPRSGTTPLYRCFDAREHAHFASNEADCEKLGTMERLLGYALRR